MNNNIIKSMNIIFNGLIILFLFFYIGHTEINFDPFSFKILYLNRSIGFIIILIGYLILLND